jgi:CheY-like chemotaxis protein
MEELHPDLILVDVSMPNLEKSGLELLKEVAKNTKRMIVLTGEMVETNSALLQSSFEKRDKADELASEGETAGG